MGILREELAYTATDFTFLGPRTDAFHLTNHAFKKLPAESNTRAGKPMDRFVRQLDASDRLDSVAPTAATDRPLDSRFQCLRATSGWPSSAAAAPAKWYNNPASGFDERPRKTPPDPARQSTPDQSAQKHQRFGSFDKGIGRCGVERIEPLAVAAASSNSPERNRYRREIRQRMIIVGIKRQNLSRIANRQIDATQSEVRLAAVVERRRKIRPVGQQPLRGLAHAIVVVASEGGN